MMKRIALSLLSVGLIAGLVAGGTFALFTAQTTNQNNTFTAGTVTLGAPVTTLVDVTNIAPGDGDTETYDVTYTGSLDAWLGLDASISGDLTTCNPGVFTVDISGGLADVSLDSSNLTASDEVIGKFAQNGSANLTIDWLLAGSADNDCQGDTATISLTVKAVQAKNNSVDAADAPIDYLDANAVGPDSWN